ncbi:RNA-directed DNA polymerase, eukaryota, reverse transcriptase zinc-binding domain protein [Tanacetum coccineum]
MGNDIGVVVWFVFAGWINYSEQEGAGGIGGVERSMVRKHATSVYFRLRWLLLWSEVRRLEEKGINLLLFMKKKLGNGLSTLFWDDVWCDGGKLKNRFPRAYALENSKQITVGQKLAHPSLYHSFRRHPRGGLELTQVEELAKVINPVVLTQSPDSWSWTLNNSGGYTVASSRNMIDSRLLPKGDLKTRWIRYVPNKVNTFAWKVMTNSLPTRFNISRRGIDIESLSCVNCDVGIETNDHLFFACNTAKKISKLINRWWDVPFMDINSYGEWRSWIDNVKLPKKNKSMFQDMDQGIDHELSNSTRFYMNEEQVPASELGMAIAMPCNVGTSNVQVHMRDGHKFCVGPTQGIKGSLVELSEQEELITIYSPGRQQETRKNTEVFQQQIRLVKETSVTLLDKIRLGFFGWLASKRQGMLEPVKVEGCILPWDTVKCSGKKPYGGTVSMQDLQGVEFEETAGRIIYYERWNLIGNVETNYEQEEFMHNESIDFSIIQLLARNAVKTTINLYLDHTPGFAVKAKGNVLGMEIVRDQSGNTLRVSQSRMVVSCIYVGLEARESDGLHRLNIAICICEAYMALTEAAKEAIWLKGLAIESGFELKIVAGIATRALSKAVPGSRLQLQ